MTEIFTGDILRLERVTVTVVRNLTYVCITIA